MISRRFLLLVTLFFSGASAFTVNKQSARSSLVTSQKAEPRTSSTALSERRWNFNEGQSPWGLKKNAEIWNGRVAQMAFVFVFLQELIQGKGVVQGIQEGDPVNLAAAGAFFVTALGLTGFLALKGDDDYVQNS
mmetsp:Transcript_22472/g.46821  ORF Transcript_22472/g.46821 Transcript_22472/m.46821 type:complete len:134 (+) Transcript_22472:144-545(+)